MKLYSFDYYSYGECYHVMSDNPEQALKSIIKYLKHRVDENVKDEIRIENSRNDGSKPMLPIYNDNECKFFRDDGSSYLPCTWEDYLSWEKSTIDNLPEGYEIIERDINEVLETERC